MFMASQPTPQNPPNEHIPQQKNRSLIAGRIKGNHWLIMVNNPLTHL